MNSGLSACNGFVASVLYLIVALILLEYSNISTSGSGSRQHTLSVSKFRNRIDFNISGNASNSSHHTSLERKDKEDAKFWVLGLKYRARLSRQKMVYFFCDNGVLITLNNRFKSYKSLDSDKTNRNPVNQLSKV